MIESLQIRDFRGIQQGKIDCFSKFNLLVGPNNSGKSAIIEALYLACTASRKAQVTIPTHGLPDSIRLKNPKDISIEGSIQEGDLLGDNPALKVLNRHQHFVPDYKLYQNALSLALTSDSPSHIPDVKIHAVPRSSSLTDDGILLFGYKDSSNFSPDNDKNQGWLSLTSHIISNADPTVGFRLMYCWFSELTHYQKGDAAWMVTGELPKAQNTLLYDVQNTLNHLPMDFFKQMIGKVPGWSQKIAQSFKRVFGIAKDFNVQFLPVDNEQKFTQGWIAPQDQIALTIDSYGDGARAAFKVLTPLIALSKLVSEDNPGVFFWEEPELFQNPQTLGRLLDEIAALMKDKPLQLFIATHSMEVVANFVRLVSEEKIAENDLQTITLNLHEGQLSSSSFNAHEVQDWTEMHLDVRVPGGRTDNPLTYHINLPEAVHAIDET